MNNRLITVGKNPTTSSTHGSQSQIANASEIRLKLSSERRFGGGLFRDALALETVIGAVKSGKPIILTLYLSRDDDDLLGQLIKFCRLASNRVALLLSDDVLDRQGNRFPPELVSDVRAQIIEESNFFDAMTSRHGVRGGDITAVYNEATLPERGATQTFPLRAYSRPEQGNVSRMRLESFVHHATQSRESAIRHSETSNIVSAITTVAYETFDNTDKHALADANGDPVPRGARGLQVRRTAVPKKELAELSVLPDGIPDILKLSLDSWSRRNTSGASIECIEVTVFDSGPGLASRILGCDAASVGYSEELAAVRRCFTIGTTSSAQHGRGRGLNDVLIALNERSGIVRLRTGRVSLYGRFDTRAKDEEVAQRLFPEQARGLSHNLRGSVVSMLLPLVGQE